MSQPRYLECCFVFKYLPSGKRNGKKNADLIARHLRDGWRLSTENDDRVYFEREQIRTYQV